MTRALVHPRMLQSMPNVFQTELRFQSPVITVDTRTRQQIKTYANVSGMTGVQAHVEAVNAKWQARLPDSYREYTTHVISLQLHTDDIGDDWIAIDDENDMTYKIRGTDTNSQNLYTYMYCEEITL